MSVPLLCLRPAEVGYPSQASGWLSLLLLRRSVEVSGVPAACYVAESLRRRPLCSTVGVVVRSWIESEVHAVATRACYLPVFLFEPLELGALLGMLPFIGLLLPGLRLLGHPLLSEAQPRLLRSSGWRLSEAASGVSLFPLLARVEILELLIKVIPYQIEDLIIG